ncbi:hypothetical protein ACFQV4_13910 [Streptomyces thermocarboxydus]
MFAPAGGVALTWSQPEPGAVPRFPTYGPARSRIGRRPGDRARSAHLVLERPGRAGLVCLRPGSWAVPLSGTPADRANVLLRQVLDGYDCTVIAHRGRTGTVLVGVCGTEAEASGLWWGDTGRTCLETRPWRTMPTAGSCSPSWIPTGNCGWPGRAMAQGCRSRTGCGFRRDALTRIRQQP